MQWFLCMVIAGSAQAIKTAISGCIDVWMFTSIHLFLTKIGKRRQPLFLAKSRDTEQGEFVEADAFGHGELAR